MKEIVTVKPEKLSTRGTSVCRELSGSMYDFEMYNTTSWMPY